MANLTIKTNLINVSDSASSTTSVSLDGVPSKTVNIITDRVFTVSTGHEFVTKPYIIWNVNNRSSYNVVKTETSTTTTFTVKYNRPLNPPSTDVITFYAKAKKSKTPSGINIHNINIDTRNIKSIGETRLISVYGDIGARFNLDVLTWPKISPNANGTTMIGGTKTYTIGANGVFNKGITFPSTTELTDYKIVLTEEVSGSFTNSLKTPHNIIISQYPQSQVQLLVTDGGSVSDSITPATTYFPGEYRTFTPGSFSIAVVKNSDDLFSGQTDTVDGAFSGTTMTLTTNYATKKIAVGDIVTHANFSEGTYIIAVNVDSTNDKYYINQPPTAEIANGQTITIDTFTPWKDEGGAAEGYDDFTQTTGQGATTKNNLALDTTEASDITISNTSITIDNSGTNAEATITGDITITHGYDGHGGHTRLALDLNDILRL